MENRWLKRAGYGSGDFACNLVFGTMASYLMFFYTDVFGIGAAVVGAMLCNHPITPHDPQIVIF